MATIEVEDGRARCPDSIAIIGGGRWARVLARVLCEIVPGPVAISVHSRRNAGSMAAWVEAQGLGKRIGLSSAWPDSMPASPGAVVVANAARDHEVAVEWALSAGVPVLVEKPIAPTFAAARRLADGARASGVRLGAANVFLFARYLENFARLLADARGMESLRIEWTDPRGEERYGEPKRYDSSLPVFADWLPHVVSIAGALLPVPPEYCGSLRVERGGAALHIELTGGSVPCAVTMERNADRRRRILRARAGGEDICLDFSTEPGAITRGSSRAIGDQYWSSRRRPVARMLAAFLGWAAGGERDPRLDVEPGLRACRIIDQTSAMYRPSLLRWLNDRLAAPVSLEENLVYALTELLQADGPLPGAELDRRMDVVLARLSGADGKRWSEELTRTGDPSRLLKSLAA
jgi:predicted dehydrogenase